MELTNLSLLAILYGFLQTILAAPMESNQHESGERTRRGPSRQRRSGSRSSQGLVDYGAQGEYPFDHTSWNSQGHSSYDSGGSESYDLSSHFGTGMDLRGSAHPNEIRFERYQPPSAYELQGRYGKYKTYPWQRALPQAALEQIYAAIGSHWPTMSTRTFKDSWDRVNSALHDDSGIAELIVQGDGDAIENVAIHALPEQLQGQQGQQRRQGTPRLAMTMKAFLESHKGKTAQSGYHNAIIEEEPVHEETVPDWSPLDWDDGHRNALISVLRRYWRIPKEAIESHLEIYGRTAVTKYGSIILGSDTKKSRRAIEKLSNSSEGSIEKDVEHRDTHHVDSSSSWSPPTLNESQKSLLVRKLKDQYNMDDDQMFDFLHKAGPETIETYARRILSRDFVDMTYAARELMKYVTEKENYGKATSGSEAEHQGTSSWAPEYLDEELQKILVDRLKRYWKLNDDDEVITELSTIDPSILAKHAITVLGSSKSSAKEAAKIMRKNKIQANEEEKSQATESHHTQQYGYDQQDPYGSHYGQQHPYWAE